MSEITVDFNVYLPTPSTYYCYYEVLKAHKFIRNEALAKEVFDTFIGVHNEIQDEFPQKPS